MRKIAYLIIISCLVLAGFLFRGKLGSFLNKENNFIIADTASVNRIEIISADSIILFRQDGFWLLNGKPNASYVAINNFLFAFQRIGVTGVISKPELHGEKDILLNVFEGRKRHSFRFYETEGISFLQKEGSEKRFSIVVSGFPDTNPSELVSAEMDHWSDRTLINLKPSEILEVAVLYPYNPDQDFRIVQSEGVAKLYEGFSDIEISETRVDKEKLDFYLSYFGNVFYDYTENDDLKSKEEARWILKIEDVRGREYELKVYPYLHPQGEDMYKGLVQFNNQPGLKVTRFMVLDLLLQDRDHFLKSE